MFNFPEIEMTLSIEYGYGYLTAAKWTDHLSLQ